MLMSYSVFRFKQVWYLYFPALAFQKYFKKVSLIWPNENTYTYDLIISSTLVINGRVMGTSAHAKIDTENMPDVSQLKSECFSL